jgi:hypothetical protein
MAPLPAQVEEEVSDAGSEEQEVILRRSPRRIVKRNVACEKGKQKDAAPASRKQLNTETDDNGEGKQKGAPKGGKTKTKTKGAGKGKQDGKPSGAKLAPTDDGKKKHKTDKPEEKDASAKATKGVNKSKRDREHDVEDVEFVKARKIRVSTGKPKKKTRNKVVARQQVVEVVEEEEEDDEDEDESLYETPNSEDYDSDSSNGAHGEGREEAFVDERMDDEDDFDDDEEDNREETSLTRTGHTARATVRPSGGNAVVVATNPVAQSIARVQVTDLLLGGEMPIRGMSKSESLRVQQKHVADRIRVFVKTDIFRRIKFINSDAMFQKAITLVMDHENVPQNRRGQYQSIYESTFNDALNTKRSSCEQSGGRIVRESLTAFKESGKDFFTIDELCKLRRSEMEREKEAFFWFYGTFLECVCGKRNWGRQKQHQRISEATDKGSQAKTVTISDEAFALLIFENYIDKWISTSADDMQDAGLVEADMPGRRKQPRHRGKFTSKKSGHCKYGGWSREGMARFNELYKLVREDRACPQAAAMEGELLAFCKAKHGGVIGSADGGQDEGAVDAGSAPVEALAFVEAAWDLDD